MAIERVYTGEDAAVTVASVPFRWSTYVMAYGQMLDNLLQAHFGTTPRRICFILGRGFDPRMNRGLDAIIDRKSVV